MKKTLLTTLFFLTIFFAVDIPKADALWYGTAGWTYRKSITIDETKVAGSANHTSFPVMVDITDSGLAANAQADGDDILFTSADGTTKLDHEIEIYTTATGRLTAWVEIPTLDYNDNTVIYMYYGNSGASNQQNATGVWDTYYKGVYHLKDGSTTLVMTSSTGSNNGSAIGNATSTSGKLDGAATFDGTGDGISLGSGTDFILDGDYTLSAWVNITSWAAGRSIITRTNDPYPRNFDWGLWDNGKQLVASGVGASFEYEWSTNTVSTGTWTYVGVTVSGTTITFYKNGAADGTGTLASSRLSPGTQDTQIGLKASTYNPWLGKIDEVRISKGIARSTDWITTEYNNQSATSTFYTIGTEETDTSSIKNAGTVLNGRAILEGRMIIQ